MLQRNFHLLACSPLKLQDRSSPKFYDTVALVALLNHAYTKRYTISFMNPRTTEVQSLPFFFTKSVVMATSLEISEKEVQIDHLHPKVFIW